MPGQSPIANPNSAKAHQLNDSDVTLQTDFADLISQARESSVANAEAVEQARKLLDSAQLTTPENIRSAARDILQFGV